MRLGSGRMLFSDRLMVEISNWRLSRSLCDPLSFYFIFSFGSFWFPSSAMCAFVLRLPHLLSDFLYYLGNNICASFLSLLYDTLCVCKYDLACSCHSSVCPSVVCPPTPSPFPLFCFTSVLDFVHLYYYFFYQPLEACSFVCLTYFSAFGSSLQWITHRDTHISSTTYNIIF